MIDLIHLNLKDQMTVRYRGSTWGLVSLELSMVWKIRKDSIRKSGTNLTLAIL